ncbi:MAG: hypothetical protein ACOVNL_04145 [Prochlorococcaceae cyanobacterium]
MGRAERSRAERSSPIEDLDTLKERQLLVRLVAELGQAQFGRGDRHRSERLWQEAAQLNLDPERILHLLYGGHDLDDREVLLELDRCWSREQGRRARGAWARPAWLRGAALRPRPACAAPRSARPAAAPARPAGR